ncbi:MAG: HlyD family efflux transporter periplasmic adaptor subunit [Phycisphaerae bacterium]|nr:HlyD family efflux transporter periplasmic adaptor subunit [Phycisphaerae bacterium]
MLKWITILVALLGLGLTAYTVATSDDRIPTPPPAQAPSINPFGRGIASQGVIEPASRAVGLAAPEPGLIVEVFVRVNDTVKRGAPLFRLDGALLEAELPQRQAAKRAAEAEVARLRSLPRAEDVPPLRAEVADAAARLGEARWLLRRIEQANERNAATPDEVARRSFAVETAEAVHDAARARLDKLTSGAWEPDVRIAEAALARAEADLESLRMRLARLTVRAPIDGTVLRLNAEPGEFTSGGAASMSSVADAPMVLGDLSELHVRAQVDEEDTPQLRAGARAVARVRGAADVVVPLVMLRIEPFASPKMSLMGTTTERVDTRIVEAVFRVEGATTVRLYPGQVVDVFIETEASPRDGSSPGPGADRENR